MHDLVAQCVLLVCRGIVERKKGRRGERKDPLPRFFCLFSFLPSLIMRGNKGRSIMIHHISTRCRVTAGEQGAGAWVLEGLGRNGASCTLSRRCYQEMLKSSAVPSLCVLNLRPSRPQSFDRVGPSVNQVRFPKPQFHCSDIFNPSPQRQRPRPERNTRSS